MYRADIVEVEFLPCFDSEENAMVFNVSKVRRDDLECIYQNTRVYILNETGTN